MMKGNLKSMSGILALALLCGALAGCAGNAAEETPLSSSEPASQSAEPVSQSAEPAQAPSPNASGEITVITREPGSGTRGAFIEMFGVEVKGEDGTKTDQTTPEAATQSSTNAVMTQVASDKNAIGYISLGSLGDTVKALRIDGAEATAENIKSGAYKVARPFNIATKGEASGLAADFISFILSAEGQAVVEQNGYIKLDDAPAYAGTKPEGKIVVGGSSSVTPVMEKLKEAYLALNPGAAIDIQQSDSTAGMQGALDGTYDIGMASRELKDEEAAALTFSEIALDGIAVIVNLENPTGEMTGETVRRIYTGEITDWADAQ